MASNTRPTAALLLEQGIELVVIAERLGHSNVGVTRHCLRPRLTGCNH